MTHTETLLALMFSGTAVALSVSLVMLHCRQRRVETMVQTMAKHMSFFHPEIGLGDDAQQRLLHHEHPEGQPAPHAR